MFVPVRTDAARSVQKSLQSPGKFSILSIRGLPPHRGWKFIVLIRELEPLQAIVQRIAVVRIRNA